MMTSIAPFLVAASAAIVLVLGSIHLLYTFRGDKLHPRDPALLQRLREVAPVITRQTTMWKAWVGFNASHSVGLLLFGAVWGHLALVHPRFLFESPFLLGLGLVVLLGYVALARRYFFRIPFRGVVIATVLYLAGVAAAWA